MNLPSAAVNYVTSTFSQEDAIIAARNLINLALRKTKTECAIQFLTTCLQRHVVPRFIEDHFAWLQGVSKKSVLRKVKSLKRELIRDEIDQHREKLCVIEREIGYAYLHVTRRSPKEQAGKLLDAVINMVREEERLIHCRHRRKWFALTDCSYPVCAYFFIYAPRFPFPYYDDFWYVRPGTDGATVPFHASNEFINDTDLSIPSAIGRLLEKGPNFRIPNKVNTNVLDKIDLAFEVLTYKLRWFEKLGHRHSDANTLSHIPFHKNSVKLPPHMSDDKERHLNCLKHEILRVAKQEIINTRKKKDYRALQNQIQRARQFFARHDLSAVSSDKTKKIVVLETSKLISNNEMILSDPETYKPIPKSRQNAIAKQANKIIQNMCRGQSHSSISKLLTCGSRPAKFFSMVKDHKPRNDYGHPLRPIASVHNRKLPPKKLIGWSQKFLPSWWNLFPPISKIPMSSLADYRLLTRALLLRVMCLFLWMWFSFTPASPLTSALTPFLNSPRTIGKILIRWV